MICQKVWPQVEASGFVCVECATEPALEPRCCIQRHGELTLHSAEYLKEALCHAMCCQPNAEWPPAEVSCVCNNANICLEGWEFFLNLNDVNTMIVFGYR